MRELTAPSFLLFISMASKEIVFREFKSVPMNDDIPKSVMVRPMVYT